MGSVLMKAMMRTYIGASNTQIWGYEIWKDLDTCTTVPRVGQETKQGRRESDWYPLTLTGWTILCIPAEANAQKWPKGIGAVCIRITIVSILGAFIHIFTRHAISFIASSAVALMRASQIRTIRQRTAIVATQFTFIDVWKEVQYKKVCAHQY